MKNSVSFEQIVARLAEVLSNPILSAAYHTENEQYEGICGWAGVMAPLSRPAFLKTFGEKTVLAAESEARKIIHEKAEAYERSHFHAHELEADEHKGVGCPAPVREGQFVWAVSSCMKGDGGYTNEIKYLCEDNQCRKNPPRLCCIEKVIHVDELPMSREDCDRLVSDHELRGGTRSDDLAEDVDVFRLSKDELATFYTIAAAVVDKFGRWYLADAEGYDYVRYYYSPLTWEEVMAPEVAEFHRLFAEQKAEEERQKAQEAADHLADYRARCQKWEGIMVPIKPYDDAVDSCYRSYEKLDYRHRRNSREAKALRSAETKRNNARKRNILAMAQAAFPGVKFSVKKYDGWGKDYVVSWQDGPTEEEFDAATDLNLFVTFHDTFDGMQDMASTVREEHTDFADKFIGTSNSIETNRTMSDEKRTELIATIYAAAPAADEGKDGNYEKPHDYTNAEVRAVSEAFGLSMCTVFPHGDYSRVYIGEIMHRVFVHTSYYKMPEAPTPDPTTTRGKKSRQNEEKGATESNAAPAPGLSLVELPEGGVAVVGADWKDTYFHKREIKAHGCTWNKEAKQWQATDPESVATVRAWFGQGEQQEADTDDQETATDTGEVAPSPTPAEVSEATETAQDAPRYSMSAKSQKIAEEDAAIAAKYGYTLDMAREHYGRNYKRFHELKETNHSTIFFFRMGEYYELYGRDARIAAVVLNHFPAIAPRVFTEGAEDYPYLFVLLPLATDQIGYYVRCLEDAGHKVVIKEDKPESPTL